MKQIAVKADSTLLILEGPSPLGIEHSLFDERVRHEGRKHVLFSLKNIEVRDADWIQKYDGLHSDFTPSMVIVAVHRKDPFQGICTDWILWTMDGGAKYILYYSTSSRTGCGKKVEKFPVYDV
jgi:hypothetical protein